MKRNLLTHALRVLITPMKIGVYLLLTFLLTSQSFADTTWISGAVSGEWTRDGNPYIVVDSTWVPEGERLTLTAGVEAFFEEDQGLYVFGMLNATGSEQDSVKIRVLGEGGDWKGIRIIDAMPTVFNYLSFICPDTALHLSDRMTVSISNSLIDADGSAFWKEPASGRFRSLAYRLDFSDCVIRSGSPLILTTSRMNAVNCYLEFRIDPNNGNSGIVGDGTSIALTNCDLIGGYGNFWSGHSYFEHCRFLPPVEGDQVIRVTVTGPNGYIGNSVVQGGLSFSFAGQPGRVICENVQSFGFGAYLTSGELNNLEVTGRSGSGESDDLGFRDCSFGGWVTMNIGSRLSFNQCVFGSGVTIHGLDEEQLAVSMDHCLVNRFVSLSRIDDFLMDYCTVIDDSFYEGNSPQLINAYMDAGDNYIFSNSIFFRAGRSRRLIFSDNATMPQMRYCSIYNFDYYDWFEQVTIEDVDSTNVIADPRLSIIGGIPYLQPMSPCIDSGDPDASLDPDGSRSDIGAYYFDPSLITTILEPQVFSLIETFPNPFNSSVTISYSTGAINCAPTVKMYDLSGRVVNEIASPARTGDFSRRPQTTSLVWDASAFPAGVYIVRLESGQEVVSKKVMLIR